MPKETLLKNYGTLKKRALSDGASLFGVADIRPVKDEFFIEPRSLLDGLNYGISIGVRLSGRILDSIINNPTKIYAFHYKRVNSMLDEIAIKLANFIQDSGYSAFPVPASHVEDWKEQRGALSHRMIGHLAGLGFIGRNGLLINPRFGSQVRYATILTNFPLKTDKPSAAGCGACCKCVAVCPAKAIKKEAKDFDLTACRELLKAFANKPGIGHSICGICVKVCKGNFKHS